MIKSIDLYLHVFHVLARYFLFPDSGIVITRSKRAPAVAAAAAAATAAIHVTARSHVKRSERNQSLLLGEVGR